MDSTVQAVLKAVQRLRSRDLPSELLDLNSLDPMFQELKQKDPKFNITEGQFLSLADTHSLTYPVQTSCELNMNCPLKILTVIPSFDENDVFIEKIIHTLAIRHDGILLNDWHVLKPKVDKFLYSPSKKLALEKNGENCIPSSASDSCSLCSINEAQRPAGDACLKTIALGNEPWDVCPYDKTHSPKDKAVRLGQGQWAYSDDTPGHIVENCNSNEVVTKLPTTGLLTLNPECQYQIRDNPISTEELQTDEVIIQEISDYPSNNSTKLEENVVDTHLRQNFQVYFYSLGGTILFLIIGWAVSCYVRTCRINVRVPTSQRRRRRTRREETVTAIPLLPPVFPRVPRIQPILL
jgi:hypothetical protein